MRAQYFFNGAAYFFFLRGAALLPHPAPKSLEPRPKFACRSKISQNQIFIFVADRFSNLFDRLLIEPLHKIIFSPPHPLSIRSIKKGAVFRPLLICKLFVKIYYLTLLALLLIFLFTSAPCSFLKYSRTAFLTSFHESAPSE